MQKWAKGVEGAPSYFTLPGGAVCAEAIREVKEERLKCTGKGTTGCF